MLRDRDYRNQEWGPYVKIGIVRDERDANARTKEHQTGNPREVVAIREVESKMVVDLETQLHHRLATYCVSNEWFCLSDEEVDELLIPQAQLIVQQQEESIADFQEAAELATKESNGNARAAKPDEMELWTQWCDAVRKQSVLSANLAIHKYTLLQASAGHGGITGVVEVKSDGTPLKLDPKKLLEDYPDIYQACLSELPEAMRQRCTPQGKPKLADHSPELSVALAAAKKGRQPTRDDAATDCLPRDDAIEEAHRKYLKAYRELSPADWLVDRLEARLRASAGLCDEIEGVIRWRRVIKPQPPTLVTKMVQADHPEAYRRCCVPNQDKKLIIRPFRAYPC